MIRFENVTFAYEKGKPVLSDVSFAIGKGETVGLIGANGAGKSTVMKLLLGLAGPGAGNTGVSGRAEGKILVDVDRQTKSNLRVDDLLQMFEHTSGAALDNDRMLLG